MSQENQSFLKFSIEESIWFQKGQEVAELISISLDPDVTLQESERFVTINGLLQLSGEYKRVGADEIEEEPFSAPKFIHFVEERDDGVCEFNHHFPVDITIPLNRVKNIYDVNVEIESFDYLLPERSCLKLTADLRISGLYEENQQSEEIVEEATRHAASLVEEKTTHAELDQEEQIEETEEPQNTLFQPFEVEARKEPTEKMNTVETHHISKKENVLSLENFEADKKEEEIFTKTKKPLKIEENRETINITEEESNESSFEISFSAQRNEEQKITIQQEHEIGEESSFESYDLEIESIESSDDIEESESSPEDVKYKKKKKITKKKGLSLTEFFARKEEEEHTKIRVCIVQEGETLDRLAQKYNVSRQQILRVNELDETQNVYKGQVLYVPVFQKTK
ncbi:stage VI sporulation protein D [Bacillus aquiflavi]|uniref:Stage VI sporulation protein D n=1 Tax=Bacillus aquiflavi TaxID=2672567 RepID=A0A6B3VT77_9BACI|nr:stage VI sporulation protein D [Bacillus aquiflavi]MBA4537212.1 stage VI sporulation protein D [Bacillus aquiflavi]NEY81470.1 stage VI sporulation protein D [Bacillus aquiflavi]UAC47429.1 stage VI sporulation protein D [Bacillus aquiflavi]